MANSQIEARAYEELAEERHRHERHVDLLCAASIAPQAIAWLWSDYLALGEFHLLAGAPGTGKTTLAMEIAISSRGGNWPDGSRSTHGKVLIWTGEDSVEHTLIPRLMAAGANLANIHVVHGVTTGEHARTFEPSTDLPLLEVEIARLGGVNLLILDPIVNAVAGDSHKNTEVRRSLQPVVDIAQRSKVCVLGTSHISKGTAGRDVVERVTGSLAFSAFARMVLVTASGQGEAEERQWALVRAKSNLGPDGDGFSYGIEAVEVAEGILASRVVWQQPLGGLANELMAQLEGARGSASKTDEAARWLRSSLSQGPKLSSDLLEQAAQAGFTAKVIRGACEKLAVARERVGFGPGSHVAWHLPSAH